MSLERGKMWWYRISKGEFIKRQMNKLRRVCKSKNIHWRIIHDMYLELLCYAVEYDGKFTENGEPIPREEFSFMFLYSTEEESEQAIEIMLESGLIEIDENKAICIVDFTPYRGNVNSESVRRKEARDKKKQQEQQAEQEQVLKENEFISNGIRWRTNKETGKLEPVKPDFLR